MSSLAYPTIGKEYHDTNYAHDGFLKSTTYLSELFPFFGEFWAESGAQFNAKGIENLLFEHLLVKSIWGYIGKSGSFHFFIRIMAIRRVLTLSILVIHRIDNLFLFTFGHIVQVGGRVSLIDWLFFFNLDFSLFIIS